MTTQRRRIVGTAGHIDHGKTSLVRALTGIDTDRLPEEKKRGITIELGFAHWSTPEFQIGFIDVPGHEKFVKNMLAGIGGIDSVLLVIAADESIKPQTREHFDICRLLGIETGVVALTKADLVDRDTIELVKLEVADLVRDSFLDGRPVIPVSSSTGAGLDELRAALIESVAKAADRDRTTRAFRLPIDRAFTMKGFGSVVTGTLISGSLRREDEIEILPDRIPTKVRNIEVHGQEREQAIAGERTSVNLSDVPLDQLRRGQQLVHRGTLQPSQIVTVLLQLLPGAPELKDQSRIRFHHYSSELIGSIRLLGSADGPLRGGEERVCQIRLESPVAAAAGDRFIIRRYSPMTTIGGGVILDPHLPKLSPKTRDEFLDVFRSNRTGMKLDAIAAMQGVRGLALDDVVRRQGLTREAARRLVETEAATLIPAGPGVWIHPDVVSSVRRAAMDYLTKYFSANRMTIGVPKSEFLHRVIGTDAENKVTEFLLADLVKEKVITISGDVINAPGRSKDLSGAEGELARLIEKRFREAELQVPPVSELINTIPQKPKVIEGVISFLVKRDTLVRLAEGVYVHREVVENAREKIQTRRGETIDVAAFKEFFGLSRKVAIPLLEYFDRTGVTKRLGDRRQIL